MERNENLFTNLTIILLSLMNEISNRAEVFPQGRLV